MWGRALSRANKFPPISVNNKEWERGWKRVHNSSARWCCPALLCATTIELQEQLALYFRSCARCENCTNFFHVSCDQQKIFLSSFFFFSRSRGEHKLSGGIKMQVLVSKVTNSTPNLLNSHNAIAQRRPTAVFKLWVSRFSHFESHTGCDGEFEKWAKSVQE